MMSDRERRVWKYVEEGRLLTLKSFLEKHRLMSLNFIGDRMARSPLQLACSLGDGAVLRLLLERKADVLHKNREGDNAVHIAMKRVLEHGFTGYNDLFLPLTIRCPRALNVPNGAGVTPQDLLNAWIHTETATNFTRPSESHAERKDKVFAGRKWKFFHTSRLDNDNKKCAKGQRREAFFKSKRKDWERLRKEEKLRRLQRERTAARTEEEIKQDKKRKDNEMCAGTFDVGSTSGGTKLSYSDIPWPAPRGTVQEMLDVMLQGLDRKNVPVFRKMLRKQQALWHPDKFSQRCETRLEEKDKQRILETVTALSQELNRLAQSLRA